MNYLNLDYLQSEIKRMMEEEEERHFVLGQVASYLKPFHTPQINKWIITALRQGMRDYTFTEIADEFNLGKRFKIWGGRIPYSNYIVIRIGEFTFGNERLDYEKIKVHLTERMTEITEFISKMDFVLEYLPVINKRYQNAVEELKEIEKEVGSTSRLLKLFPLVYDIHRA